MPSEGVRETGTFSVMVSSNWAFSGNSSFDLFFSNTYLTLIENHKLTNWKSFDRKQLEENFHTWTQISACGEVLFFN